MAAKNVEDLMIGDKVDLESCPYLKEHPTAQFEYAEVNYVRRENIACMVIGYEGIDHIGYKTGTQLEVQDAPSTSPRP